MIRTASAQQRQAFGCGLKITALRVLMAMMHLKRTVEVGLVMGVSEKMTPIGSATSTRPRSGILANDADGALVPDVVVDKLGGHHVLDGLVFQHADLVSSTARRAKILRASSPAMTMGLTMRSTSSWVNWEKAAAAVRAWFTSPLR